MDKKVSIIIPVYNVSEYIDECIKSAHNQSYANIEIILVDDGSPDDSGRKCDEWAEKDSRIMVIHKENGGLSSARNAALDIATGDYICFLDGDDYIENNLVEKMVHYMDKGYDMVGFCYYALYSDGVIKAVPYKKSGHFDIYDDKQKFDFLLRDLVTGKIGWEACTRFFKRDIIDKYHLRFVDNRRIFAEDLYFTLCYCAHINRVLSTEGTMYYYRQRQDSIMGQESVRLNVGRMNELGKAVLAYYEKQEGCKYIIDHFAAIYFVIINNVISGYQKTKKLPLKELRKHIIEDINDIDFFRKQLSGIRMHKKTLYSAYSSRSRFEECYNIIQYVLDGNYLNAVIRQKSCLLISRIIRKNRK